MQPAPVRSSCTPATRAQVRPPTTSAPPPRCSTVSGELAGIAVPTLVLAGGQDRMMPPEAVGAAAREIPGATLEIIENAGPSPSRSSRARTWPH